MVNDYASVMPWLEHFFAPKSLFWGAYQSANFPPRETSIERHSNQKPFAHREAKGWKTRFVDLQLDVVESVQDTTRSQAPVISNVHEGECTLTNKTTSSGEKHAPAWFTISTELFRTVRPGESGHASNYRQKPYIDPHKQRNAQLTLLYWCLQSLRWCECLRTLFLYQLPYFSYLQLVHKNS